MPAKDLAAHPLVQKALDNLRPLLDTASHELLELANQGQVRSKENKQLLEVQWYDYDVFSNVTAITSAIERLKQAQHLIRMFPRPSKTYEKEGINQQKWIEYHYSYYAITLVSLFDIALLLTNSVFRLGNREHDCKPDLVMKNSWVAQTPVERVLKKLKQLIEPHKRGRNQHVHQGRMQSIASVMQSDELDRLQLISSAQMLGEATIDKEIINWAYKGHVKKICERIQNEIDQFYDVIWRLFDGLLPTYDKKATVLHEERRRIAE